MSSSTSNAEDRRIARTKAALRDALIALMNERGLDGFTINDLCAKADLNRARSTTTTRTKATCSVP